VLRLISLDARGALSARHRQTTNR